MRDLKRYLNLVIPRYREVFLKVDSRDYFLLYLLCYKDFGIYSALHSRRILQLDISTQTYVLIPSYKEELKQVSQWKGSKSILERLFALSSEEEETVPRGLSLRNVSGFDTYFRGFNFLESSLYRQVLSGITLSMRKGTLLKDIDDLIEEEWGGLVVGAFRYLVGFPCRRGENRAATIKVMAYMAFTWNLPEWEAENLKKELFKFFSLDQYKMYIKMDVVPDLPSYKSLLEPMLTFVIKENPQWISSIIQDLSQAGSVFPGGCIYSVEELSKLLSDHQKSKGAQ